MGNTITADLNGRTSCITDPLWQYDYGQILIISGVELPDSYEVHFSDKRLGISTAMLGDETGVDIPDMYLLSGRDVTAWVYLHETEADGETRYDITIPVKERAKPTYDEPTPVQQAFIEQAIAAMNAAVQKTDSNVEKYPRVIEGYWCVWDADEEQFVSTGVHAQGDPGFSPIANVVREGNKAVITITDESGTTTANVYDGDYENLIDDTAGAGVTDKAWSADKLVTQFELKAPVYSPNFTGIISHYRKAGMSAGTRSVALGYNSVASGMDSFAEGNTTTASGSYSHSEGITCSSTKGAAHSEGNGTTASGSYAHSEGHASTASGQASHAENYGTKASGDISHAEGDSTEASGQGSHAEGRGTIANHQSQHAGGEYNVLDPFPAYATARGTYVEIIGNGTATNNRSNARTLDWSGNERLKGDLYINCNVDSTGGTAVGTTLGNKADKADTVLTTTLSRGRKESTTVGTGSFAFGNNVTASGNYSHAEGGNYTSGTSVTGVVASGVYSHAEGRGTQATAVAAHSEGTATVASGSSSHSEGHGCSSTSDSAHSEGYGTMASGGMAHSEGNYTVASGLSSHAEGDHTIANHMDQHAFGSYNVADPSVTTGEMQGNYIEIVGNGTGNINRSNARTLDWNGNERIKGDLYVGCNADSSGGSKVISESALSAMVATTTETQAIIDEWGESA